MGGRAGGWTYFSPETGEVIQKLFFGGGGISENTCKGKQALGLTDNDTFRSVFSPSSGYLGILKTVDKENANMTNRPRVTVYPPDLHQPCPSPF